MIFFEESSLRHAVAEFAVHSHSKRNHQGLQNKVIQPKFPAFPESGTIRSRKRIGGLLHYYNRDAALSRLVRVFGQYVNGRSGTLALWELYRRGFDPHHIFSVDELYWEDRPRYYAALDAVRREGEDLSGWLEYAAEGLQQTLERVWSIVQKFSAYSTRTKLALRPKQEQLLQLLRDHRSMASQEIWEALGVTRQGAIKLIQPLLEAEIVERIGSRKSGRYILK